MRVPVLMTAVAIKRGNIGHRMRARAPGKKMCDFRHGVPLRSGIGALPPADPRQHLMVHDSRPDRLSLMLDMTAAAFFYIRMKRGRLQSKNRRISCMTGHAGHGRSAFIRGVTGAAFILEKCMGLRERPRARRHAPERLSL